MRKCRDPDALPVTAEGAIQGPYERDALPVTPLQAAVEVEVVVELNITDLETLELFRTLLGNSTFPLVLSPAVDITDINLTTVCYPYSSGFQCTCEDQYHWSSDKCLLYGSCDDITDDTCGCINALPDGEYCQLSSPPVVYEYLTTIELNTTNVTNLVIQQLRTILGNISYPFTINRNIQISEVNITTVCYQDSAGFQCTCEDQYRWSCDKCLLYGSCDNITDDTCGCINALPDGEYCQLSHQLSPPVVYEYLTTIELNTTNVTNLVIQQLRTILGNISYPFTINRNIQISEVNITTVCYQDSAGFQCTCEDQYRWSCDKCLLYGSCDIITDDTCGCINALPDGEYCQLSHQLINTTCPPTSPPPSTTTSPLPSTSPPVVYEYLTTIELNTTNVTHLVIQQLRTILGNISYPFTINRNIQISEVNITTVCYQDSAGFQCTCEDQYRWSCDKCLLYGSCDNITDDTCGCINALPDGEYCQLSHQLSPPVVYEYLTTIELNTTNVTNLVIQQLRTILGNISYPFTINRNIQISEVNITTVCYQDSAGFQCTCEDQYRWSCDKCLLYGSCDIITDDTCGCINALPDGEYCQLSHQLINTTCPPTSPPPSTTTSPLPSTSPPVVYEYLTTIELNTTNVTHLVIQQLRTILGNISYPFTINRNIQISEVNITTVCYQDSAGFQCTCEDQYRWSCDKCLLYGSCDNITDDTCGCINALPDGEYCQLSHQLSPPVVYEYLTTIELNTTNVTNLVIQQLRTILGNISYPFTINRNIQISEVNITTVCYQDSAGFQCTCEDQYRWSCDKCLLYGSCDNITDDTCGCINALPDGEYCQLSHQLSPPVVYEYLTTIELNTTNVTNLVIQQLRTILGNISYPFTINRNIQISEVNITTVCYQDSAGFQCTCEDQYRWSCDKCLLYGSCDNITDDTCGCINALPDGEYCQLSHQLSPPVVYEYLTTIELNTTNVTNLVIQQLRTILGNISYPFTINRNIQISEVNITTVCYQDSAGFQCTCEDQYRWSCDKCLLYGSCDNITDDTCGCINALPDGEYCQLSHQLSPPVVYEYLTTIELNTTNVTNLVIQQLRTILGNISYPFTINRNIQISEVNITTVCYQDSAGFQCTCEDQYRWSCDKCLLYGSCDNITDDTCGCINALPDGEYCQLSHQLINTTCPPTSPPPSTTTSPLPSTSPPVVYEYLTTIELNTTNVTNLVIQQLRTILGNISYPFTINRNIQISEVNITTVCYQDSAGFQCTCEDQYRWSCDKCLLYGSCDNITDDTCGCINALPDGEYCQLSHQLSPPVVYEYLTTIELNTTNVTNLVIQQLRTILGNISYPFTINRNIQISEVNITTVCYQDSAGFQCTCEDQYRWSCDKCLLYGSCDNITDDTCGCINALPDGEYCQLSHQLSPPVVYEYLTTIELNTTNVTHLVIQQLRTILGNISYPFTINRNIQISEVNITTVCYQDSAGFQCTCEDQYRWSCDKCLLYGSCDNITDDTCGCINALPDGEYCQLSHQLSPLVVYEYLTTIELNTTNVTNLVIQQLRTILGNISYPFTINRNIQISEVNITTVCYQDSAGFQCTCEDQYRWSCDKCLLYGSCDNITDDTCGCINALPDGEYCQLSHQLRSVIIQFIVQTTEVSDQLKSANDRLITNMAGVAKVIGSVTAFTLSQSKTPIRPSHRTGAHMILV
ncbi:Adhesion G protein-coupled receptor F5 [Merluccius polli]|uniref:Adhesion G protein-coupled receptor F5 n=1 Tax=Merluccius polli TaxID=89951 RepID=A0AA47NTZ2_MERPO|nr:Adhesion G protein-coupled receptor F5 [Merluccius polli]